MKKIVTFGEILLRLTPPGYLKFSQGTTLCATFGGSETNVAVSLSHFGLESEFVTKLPQNYVADTAIANLRSHNVGVGNIARGGERIGLYYYENTASVRAAQIVYDRADSSYSTSSNADYDWEHIFTNAGWFHWSGIGPSLSASAADVTLKAIEKANEMGLTVSADLNYRKHLWRYGKKAEEVMPVLAEKCDVLFGTEGEYQKTFGVEPVPFTITDVKADFDVEKHKEFCKEVMKRAPKCKKMFVALRNVIDAKHHIFVGLLYTQEGEFYVSRTYLISPVVDCVGCGDAFAAGMIYGVCEYGADNQKALDFATAAAIIKNSYEGDFNLASSSEVKTLMAGNDNGAVAR